MSPRLQRILRKKYEPVTMVTLRFSGNDIALKTDREGNPVLMFIGRVDDSGRIKGEQYVSDIEKRFRRSDHQRSLGLKAKNITTAC